MCGIAGILTADLDRAADPARVRRMTDALRHRGPDGEGVRCDGPIALGHRRLAIVDLAAGAQPMSNEDGRVWVVFNGEIYNHQHLRSDLIARGHVYRTRSDTETIVHAYESFGDACVEHLEGMFAFAIWDGRRQRLLLARDRLGIKPLYYAWAGNDLVFASEIKALLVAGVRAEFHDDVLPEFLANRYVAADETFFAGVKRLPPGHTLAFCGGGRPSCRRYWTLPAPMDAGPTPSLARAAESLEAALHGAVRRHLMSDVPLGVFLSGGIDSSALAAIAARQVPHPLQTFSVGFHEAEANELPYARLMAKAIGAEHREVSVGADEYFDSLPHLIWQQDEPLAFSSNVPLYFVSRLARDHVKVVLTGEGADELFLGYNRYRVTYWNERLSRPYVKLTTPAWRARIARTVRGWPRPVARYSARTFLGLEDGLRAHAFDNFAVFGERAQRALFADRRHSSRDPYAVGLRLYDEAGGGPLHRLSATDLQTYLCELLMKQDRMSMAASIESRVPFLDDRLVAAVAPMDDGLKLRGWRTKAVLREAVKRLVPPAILTRRKMGFPVPVGRWLASRHSPVVDEFVLGPRTRSRGWFDAARVSALAEAHRTGTADHGEQLWLLINLEIWQRVFCDGEAPSDVMRPVTRRMGTRHASVVDQNGGPVAA